MKATVVLDYKGMNIIVDENDQEFSRLSITELKKCDNAIIEKSTYGWTGIIDDNIYHIEQGNDSHYGKVLYADLIG